MLFKKFVSEFYVEFNKTIIQPRNYCSPCTECNIFMSKELLFNCVLDSDLNVKFWKYNMANKYDTPIIY